MNNFIYYNPVKIVFGKKTISQLENLLPVDKKILLIYGGGSIKKNNVYNQVLGATKGHTLIEFSGIEANPEYKTCLKAIEFAKVEKVEYILAVGGGSVIDAAKFIAAGVLSNSSNPWETIVKKGEISGALPIGTVLTLPATGSEMNSNSVISNRDIEEKAAFSSPFVFPEFSILDPEVTYSLPPRQVANGVVDAFIHVLEQYLTTDINTPVQDRWAEGILLTLINLGRKVMDNPTDYENRCNLVWAATTALNGIIGVGVDQDWATHGIGHELTAMYGVDHGQSLAIVLPGLLSIQRKDKEVKLLQYAARVWGITQGDKNVIIDEVITRTSLFFQSVGVSGLCSDYGIDPEEAAEKIGEIFNKRGSLMGEHQNITGAVVKKILLNRQCLY
ncbi:MAG: NADH-dependent alcohol dehydrogenase [Spirochaetaceae bacterium 4572_7]|nr:MAG: NADH-dependent alcohol dehydrogenase [Spirochaetaceae bacterium 4572_7]